MTFPPVGDFEPRNPFQQKAFVDALMMLRDFAGDMDKGLRSREAIVAYLNEIGCLNGMGRPVTMRTLDKWRKHRGFPGFNNRLSDGTFVTKLMVLAWLWSHREFRRVQKRYHPKLKPPVPRVPQP